MSFFMENLFQFILPIILNHLIMWYISIALAVYITWYTHQGGVGCPFYHVTYIGSNGIHIVIYLYWCPMKIQHFSKTIIYCIDFWLNSTTMTWLTAMEYLCHKWPRICSTCRKHFPVLSSFMTYHQVCN